MGRMNLASWDTASGLRRRGADPPADRAPRPRGVRRDRYRDRAVDDALHAAPGSGLAAGRSGARDRVPAGAGLPAQHLDHSSALSTTMRVSRSRLSARTPCGVMSSAPERSPAAYPAAGSIATGRRHGVAARSSLCCRVGASPPTPGPPGGRRGSAPGAPGRPARPRCGTGVGTEDTRAFPRANCWASEPSRRTIHRCTSSGWRNAAWSSGQLLDGETRGVTGTWRAALVTR